MAKARPAGGGAGAGGAGAGGAGGAGAAGARPTAPRFAVALQSVRPVAKSMRWTPLVAGTVVALVLVWLLRPEAPASGGTIGSLRLGAYLLAAGAALALDDRAGATLAPSPTPLAVRRGLRLVLGLVPVALAWGLLVGLAAAVSGAGQPALPVAALTVEAVGMVALSLAAAAVAAARAADGVGGGAGPPTLTLFVLAVLMGQMRWPKHLTMFPMGPVDPAWNVAHQRWGVLALIAAAAVAGTSLDPARRRLRLRTRLAR